MGSGIHATKKRCYEWVFYFDDGAASVETRWGRVIAELQVRYVCNYWKRFDSVRRWNLGEFAGPAR